MRRPLRIVIGDSGDILLPFVAADSHVHTHAMRVISLDCGHHRVQRASVRVGVYAACPLCPVVARSTPGARRRVIKWGNPTTMTRTLKL